MTGARVAGINVTPVKGLALGNPDSVELTPTGARDDRRFFLVSADGRLVNGKRIGGDLNLARADWDAAEGVLSVALPGGEVVRDVVRCGEETSTEIVNSAVVGPASVAVASVATMLTAAMTVRSSRFSTPGRNRKFLRGRFG